MSSTTKLMLTTVILLLTISCAERPELPSKAASNSIGQADSDLTAGDTRIDGLVLAGSCTVGPSEDTTSETPGVCSERYVSQDQLESLRNEFLGQCFNQGSSTLSETEFGFESCQVEDGKKGCKTVSDQGLVISYFDVENDRVECTDDQTEIIKGE